MDLKATAKDLRSHAAELQKQVARLLGAADALDPPRPKRKPRKKTPREWDAGMAAAMRRDGQSFKEVRQEFGLSLTDSGIARRLKKAGFSWGGEPLEPERVPPEEIPGNGASGGQVSPTRLDMGTAGRTAHPDDPDARALRERLVHTEG
jgi:hypothetical protein